MNVVTEIEAIEGLGLMGDRRCFGRAGSTRKITITGREYIGQMSHFLGQSAIDPGILRRNVVVSGINLMALQQPFLIKGSAKFEATALCTPV